MKGRWRPEFGLVSLPEAEGKAVAAPAPDIPVRPSPFRAPRRPKGGLGGGLRAPAAGACRRRATHHRLHREKVVRPRCAVRLAAAHTRQGLLVNGM